MKLKLELLKVSDVKDTSIKKLSGEVEKTRRELVSNYLDESKWVD